MVRMLCLQMKFLRSDDIMEVLMKDHPDDDIVTECLQ